MAIATVSQRTTVLKQATVDQKWFVIDVEGMIVGRVATQIAMVLMGKHKPSYTPHVDSGDYVIVLNADKVTFSGNSMVHKAHPSYTTKMSKKKYYWHSLWPGGLKEKTAIEMWENKPTSILLQAVKRMMPKSALGRRMLEHKLKLFTTGEHPHQAQKPQPFPAHLMPAEKE